MKDRYSHYYRWSDIEREVNGSQQHMARAMNRHFDTALNILLLFMLPSDIPILSVIILRIKYHLSVTPLLVTLAIHHRPEH